MHAQFARYMFIYGWPSTFTAVYLHDFLHETQIVMRLVVLASRSNNTIIYSVTQFLYVLVV